MVGKLLMVAGVALLLSLAACTNRDCNWEVDDDALSEQVKNMPLEELYAFHIRLCKGCTPTRTTLAWDIAKRGEKAKKMALARSRTHDVGEFKAALAVIGAFNTMNEVGCSPTELSQLRANAALLDRGAGLPAWLREGIASSCAREPPTTVKVPGT